MPQYLPSQIDDANLAYYYTGQQTPHGIYYRLNQSNDQFPPGFYAYQRTVASQPAPSSATAPSTLQISIAVFAGDPLDYQKFRHTSLCIRSGNTEDPMVIHAVGPNKSYAVEIRPSYEPATSLRFAREIVVGSLRTQISRAQLVMFIYNTPVDNKSLEFNCQTWVGDALQRLVTAGHITQEERDRGVDGMVETILEAKHEPE